MANYRPQPQTSAPKKRKEKQKHLLPPTDSESEEEEGNDERLQPLNRLPDEVRRIPGQGKLGVYQWIGSPWQIDGDALLVFTDSNLKIYNATFRRDLVGRAGQDYKEEILQRKSRKPGETPVARQVIMTSGARLPYYAVLHVPIDPYQRAEEFKEYQVEMLAKLEKGLGRASEMKFRRVVVCIDGLRSNHMPWEQAESTAIALAKLYMRMPSMWGSIQELVIVTSTNQDQERKKRILASTRLGDEAGKLPRPRAASEPGIRLIPVPRDEQGGQGLQRMSWQNGWSGPPAQPSTQPEGCTRSPETLTSPARASVQASPRHRDSTNRTQEGDPEEWIPERQGPDESRRRSYPLRHGAQECNSPGSACMSARQSRQEEEEEETDEPLFRADPEEQDPEGQGEWGSLSSVAGQVTGERKDLRIAQRKGGKKDIEIYNVRNASERVARDVEWGYVETKDKRQAYVPEAGQTDYDIPDSWRGKLEENLKLEVTATLGEWANIIMMPTYPTLVACKELTNNFRIGYVAVAHDAMLRRMKKAAVMYSRKVIREIQKEISTDDDEGPPQPLGRQGPKAELRVKTERATAPFTGQDFQELRKLKLLVRDQRPGENIREYLREVWRLVEGGTADEEAKRLWLSHVTSQPVDRSEPARQSYERLVLEDMDDEDAHIARAQAGLERNQTLTQVWHTLKQAIAPARYVRALRAVTANRPGELEFIKMPVGNTTVPQMDAAVQSWDLAQQHWESRRSKERGNQQRTQTNAGYGQQKAPAGAKTEQTKAPTEQGQQSKTAAKKGRRATEVTASEARVTLRNAYWVGEDIYANVDGEPYLVDSGAEVSMTRRSLETKGHLKIMLANGEIDKMPYGIWKGVVWLKGPNNLLTTRDLKRINEPRRGRKSLRRRLDTLQSRAVRLVSGPESGSVKEWYKAVNIPEATEQKLEESDFSPEGKEKLRKIITGATVARFKNDCGDLGSKYVHTTEGGVHPPVRQYPLNPGAVEEMDKIVTELSALDIIREEPNPITNSPIQAVKKPEAAGGGWRPVINFKALNRRTVANRASLINPQGALKTLQVKRFKSCIDLANGFFSLRLAKQSQGKTAFTHKVLKDLGVTIYIDDVFLADDTEEEHLQRLRQVVERLTEAGLKLNLKKCQFGQFRVNYLGFQVAADLGLSDGYREKLNQVRPPASENDLQKILGLCNYVRDHVPNYQKYAKPLYACLKKKGEESEEETPKKWSWTATDQQNLGRLKAVIQDAIRLEPRSLTTRLVAEVSCEDDDAVVKVKNEGGGMVTLWSYTLSSVEKKFPQEEKELAVLARYWGTMKDLAQGQGIKVITQSQVHRYLRKETIESTKATNTRWGRWEDILLDPDLEIGPAQPANRKAQKPQETEEKSYEWILYTDGSRKGQDDTAYWGYILKQDGKEQFRQKGRVSGSAQAGEVTAILEGLLELEKRKVKTARIITDSYYCAQALKEDLTIWEENGYEGAKGKVGAQLRRTPAGNVL
ncbi:hypothetical protein D5F01_LYC18982 [Larimichthys crocea]|uniref:ribonuclease H n=1 Tax=Larimichthys crocea TaxID=215358 RepID=A0A6G0HWH3_LARCR|nr:hypothetical protein D5F01_LYC18982 [Larimichthys crocea]